MKARYAERFAGSNCGTVLSYFIGEEFVGVHVTERKETYMALHFELIACCPVVLPAARKLGEKPRHAFSLLLLKLLVNHPDNNQERFMELITKIQS